MHHQDPSFRIPKILSESSALIGQSRPQQALYDSLNNGHSYLNWAIDAALRVTNAPRGNIQVFDPASGMLKIVAHLRFDDSFLDFFKCVNGEGSACSKAFGTRQRVLVEEVSNSPIFYRTPALEVLLDAKVRAVQSTPLIGSSGSILGILSTHWPSPRRLSHLSSIQVDVLARTIARWLEHSIGYFA